MKTLKKSILLLASLVMAVSVASCINDELTEPQKEVAVKELATVDEQAASMEATLADLEALQTSAEGLDEELASVVSSIKNHIADLKAGATLLDGTLATLERQKELAEVMAVIEFGAEATKGGAALTKAVASVDKRAESWLGKHFAAYYPAAKAEASAAARLAALDLKTQKLSVEAILSDVEAGLRKDADKEELAALASSVNGNMAEAEELLATLSATTAEAEAEYTETIEAAVNDPADFDLPALKQFNSSVAGTLAEADNSLSGIIARVEACEAQLEDIRTRLGDLETDIEDLEGLLDMIQSVTFMSEYSEDRVIAYYNLDTESEERTPEGYMLRTKDGDITMKYVVRPAAAAAALTESTLWNDGLKVIGYYAEAITKAALVMEEFNIKDVTADDNGIVTLTVDNTLTDDFYFKRTGAKMALSIVSGKTDLTSRFVEIVPKDRSNKIYAEKLVVITDVIEIEMNETANLKTIVSPSGADQTVIWKSGSESVAKVTEEGLLTGWTAGTATLTATTAVTDEWGRTLEGTCAVKVNPDMKIVGPKYVEKGYAISLQIDSPRNVNPESITWSSSYPEAISIEKSYRDGLNYGVVTGLESVYGEKFYEDITITCEVAGEATLTYTIHCVEVQPKKITVSEVKDDAEEISVRFGETRDLAATVGPENVDLTKFSTSYSISDWNLGEGAVLQGSTITAKDEADLKDGKTTGLFTISLNSAYYWYDKVIQESATPLVREISVNVEPYYVADMSIPESHYMTLNEVLTTLPDIRLTSDVEGHDPSYTDLEWSSSAPDYVSVNPQTGELTAMQLTTQPVTITATVPDKSVKPGMTIAKNCYVTVTEAAADKPKIGDYFYEDGTYSTELKATAGNPVIGVIFSLKNATEEDSNLPETCVHGLVVSMVDNNSSYGGNDQGGNPLWGPSGSTNTIYHYVYANYEGVNYDHTKTNGYSSTLALKKWKEENKAKNWPTLVDVLDASLPTCPGSSSGWYIPSYQELLLLYNKKYDVNVSLGKASGTQINQQNYWSSSLYYYYHQSGLNKYHDSRANPFDMNSGEMPEPNTNNGPYNTSYPVRVILAF